MRILTHGQRASSSARLLFLETEMEELLKELMNRGFLIYEDYGGFVLCKICTPADKRSKTPLIFGTYEEALADAQEIIDWKPKKTVTARTAEHGWMMELMYRHSGLAPKFVDLGEMGPVKHDEAMAEANRRGKRHIEEFLDMDDVGWEVRVRPYHRNG